jgi:hypothetical protein
MKRRDCTVSIADTGEIEELRELEFILAGHPAS